MPLTAGSKTKIAAVGVVAAVEADDSKTRSTAEYPCRADSDVLHFRSTNDAVM